MELIGKIIAVLPERSGVSARSGSEWHVGSYVLETQGDRFPRRMNFEVFGADKIQQFNIQVGEMLRVSFDIDAREFTRRDGTVTWINQIRAWNVDRNIEAVPQMGAAPMPNIAPFGAPAPTAAPAPSSTAAPADAPAADVAPAVAPFAPAGGEDLPF